MQRRKCKRKKLAWLGGVQWPIQGGKKNFSSKKWEMLEKIDYSTYAISWVQRKLMQGDT